VLSAQNVIHRKLPDYPIDMITSSRSKSETATLGMAVLLLMLLATGAFPQQKYWTLPAADGGDVKPSPPSVHGYVLAAGKQRLTVKRDSRSADVGTRVNVQLTPKTQFFTAYGGDYNPDELRSGQYAWIWFVTADPAKAGKPPRAAVVMLLSTSVSDKPSAKVRSRFDDKK
jgi:hypothetical protein